MDPHDPDVFCPFDISHVIRRSVLPGHIVKCSRNHPNTTKRYCPFDRTHVVEAMELEAHIKECPKSLSVHIDKYQFECERTIGIPLEQAAQIEIPRQDENWDTQTTIGTYRPEEHIKDRPIQQIPMTLSKSEKRKHKHDQRLHIQSLSQIQIKPQPLKPTAAFQDEDVKKPLRTPQRCMKAAQSKSQAPMLHPEKNGTTSAQDKTEQGNTFSDTYGAVCEVFNNIDINKTETVAHKTQDSEVTETSNAKVNESHSTNISESSHSSVSLFPKKNTFAEKVKGKEQVAKCSNILKQHNSNGDVSINGSASKDLKGFANKSQPFKLCSTGRGCNRQPNTANKTDFMPIGAKVRSGSGIRN